MRIQRWVARAIPVAAAVLVGAAPVVLAQGQEIFEWSGRVDREVQLSMRGSQISSRDLSGQATRRERSRVVSAIPRQDGLVTAQLESGRGTVEVIQQPSAQNGYTTVLRVRDASGGSDNYRVAAYWQSSANGDYVGHRGRGRGVYGNDRGTERGNGNGRYGNGSMLHWSGNVDGLLEIRVQNGRVSYRTMSGAQPTAIRANVGSNMPRGNANVSVSQNQGRGSVSVVQQPSSWNGYTTVIRVNDPQSGSAFYDFDLMWQ